MVLIGANSLMSNSMLPFNDAFLRGLNLLMGGCWRAEDSVVLRLVPDDLFAFYCGGIFLWQDNLSYRFWTFIS